MRTLAEDLAERLREGQGGHSDVWHAFADRELFARTVAALAVPFRGERYTKVAGLEARGFVRGGAMTIVVDDLTDEVPARLGRLHALLRADAL